jgi:monoamine oxidase
MDTEILIIGGGLAGLRLADLLHARGQAFQLVEARDRFGGRVLSETVEGGRFDLGPSWFWPGQPRVAALIERFGLKGFDQFSHGSMAMENEHGQVQYGRGPASMQGSWRLDGGLAALAMALVEALPAGDLHLASPVRTLNRHGGGVEAVLADGGSIRARHAVIAVPPRVAAERIVFSPPLPDRTMAAMHGIATWMAGQAKAVAVYDTAFWREAGLSGDAMSRHGPMVEIHDASPADGGPFALFGFIGVPPAARKDEEALRAGLVAQLDRLFGEEASKPVALLLKDWAFDAHTATDGDRRPVHAHPAYGLPPAMQGLWDDALLFGGTEVATRFGGYIEGAFAAAEDAATALRGHRDGSGT